MRVLSSVARFAALTLGLVASTGALAFTGEEGQLIESINAYRSQAQRCGGEASPSCRRSTATPALRFRRKAPGTCNRP